MQSMDTTDPELQKFRDENQISVQLEEDDQDSEFLVFDKPSN